MMISLPSVQRRCGEAFKGQIATEDVLGIVGPTRLPSRRSWTARP